MATYKVDGVRTVIQNVTCIIEADSEEEANKNATEIFKMYDSSDLDIDQETVTSGSIEDIEELDSDDENDSDDADIFEDEESDEE